MTNSEFVLVTGATGRQGGAVARALLAGGRRVRALVRDPEAPAAIAIRALGAELVRGDLDDPASLRRACDGAAAVFSVQMPDLRNLEGDAERVHGKHLVEAAAAAGVPQLVHTSVAGVDDPSYADPSANYWRSKAYVQDLVRAAGFRHWTLLKPSFFMENFVRPSFMFANGTDDRLLTTLRPDTQLALIAVDDIGAAAAAAFADPARFHRVELELAGDWLSMREIAAVLSEALGTALEAPDLSADEAIAQGLAPHFAMPHERLNRVICPARPAFARALGIATTDFRTWAMRHLRNA